MQTRSPRRMPCEWSTFATRPTWGFRPRGGGPADRLPLLRPEPLGVVERQAVEPLVLGPGVQVRPRGDVGLDGIKVGHRAPPSSFSADRVRRDSALAPARAQGGARPQPRRRREIQTVRWAAVAGAPPALTPR